VTTAAMARGSAWGSMLDCGGVVFVVRWWQWWKMVVV